MHVPHSWNIVKAPKRFWFYIFLACKRTPAIHRPSIHRSASLSLSVCVCRCLCIFVASRSHNMCIDIHTTASSFNSVDIFTHTLALASSLSRSFSPAHIKYISFRIEICLLLFHPAFFAISFAPSFDSIYSIFFSFPPKFSLLPLAVTAAALSITLYLSLTRYD